MRQSKLFTAVITLALLGAMVVGCGTEPEEALPTVDEVVANSVVALEELTTWRTDQSIHMDMEVSGPDGGHFTISTSGKAAIDLPNRKMQSDTTTSVVALGEETETRQNVCFIEDTVYMMTDTPDMEEQWTTTRQALSGAELDVVWGIIIRGLSAGADMLKASHFEQLSVEEVDGMPCYLLEGSTDAQEFSKLFQQITGSTQALPLDVSEMFQDYEVSFWVAKDTYDLVQQKMTATIFMEIEGVKIEGNMEGTSRYYDHGKEVSIVLPPEAELENVQTAVLDLIVDNKLPTYFTMADVVNFPNPVTVATNDMSAFPDTSVCGVDKIQDANGNLYVRGEDMNGYFLYQHDNTADGKTTGLVNYLASQYTTGTYTIDAYGTVTQVTTGYE